MVAEEYNWLMALSRDNSDTKRLGNAHSAEARKSLKGPAVSRTTELVPAV